MKILMGNEPYLINQRKKQLISSIESKDFNLSIYEAFNDAVIESCLSVPLLEDRRVVILETDDLKAIDKEDFWNLVAVLPESTEFIVISSKLPSGKAADKFKPYIERLDKYSNEDSVVGFVAQILKRENTTMKKEALQEFLRRENYIENEAVNLYNLENDLMSLSSISKVIEKDMVVSLIKDNSLENVFLLAEHIKNKDYLKVKKELDSLTKDDVIPTMYLLLRELRVALKLKHFNPEQIGAKRNVFRELDEHFLLDSAESFCHAIDVIKTGQAEPIVTINQVTLNMMSQLI